MNKLSILLLVLMINLFLSCNKDKIPHNELINNIEKEGPPRHKVIFRFTWTFFGSPQCLGELCGICPGICIKVVPKIYEAPLTETEINDQYLGVAEIQFDSSNFILTLIPDRDFDNGDGYVRIEDNFDLGQDIASMLRVNNILIKEGKYFIDYSDSSRVYGVVKFNIEYD